MKIPLFSLLLTSLLAAQPILLWPAGAPGSEGKSGEPVVTVSASGEKQEKTIHRPSITPFLPDPAKARGVAGS